MPDPELQAPTGFYFALPRLVMKLRGGNARRSERSWLEANLVGFAVFGISYLIFAGLLPSGLAWWAHLILIPPLAFATFLFWLLALYVTSLVVKLIRAGGFIRGVSDSRAQIVLVAALTTFFSLCLMRGESWTRIVGALWVIGVVLNFVAAALLAGSHDHSIT